MNGVSREERAARRAKALSTDTTPGKVLGLALLANIPIAAGFILAPLLARGDASAGRAFVPWVLAITPLFATASVIVYARAKPERRAHRASRIGLLLAGTATLLWAFLLALTLAA